MPYRSGSAARTTAHGRGQCTVVERMEAEEQAALKGLLDRDAKPALEADVSSYARGRTRVWLQREMPLGPTRKEQPGLEAPELWAALARIWRRHLPGSCEVGLAIHGRIGIGAHRDASYASEVAMNVNLGKARWWWDRQRDGRPRPIASDEWTPLEGGEVLVFDSKHLHAAQPEEDDRWTVVLWKVKHARWVDGRWRAGLRPQQRMAA